MLREAVLQGQPLQSLSATRFVRRGLAGLIAWPGAEPVYVATVQGARRAPWTPIPILGSMPWPRVTS